MRNGLKVELHRIFVTDILPGLSCGAGFSVVQCFAMALVACDSQSRFSMHAKIAIAAEYFGVFGAGFPNGVSRLCRPSGAYAVWLGVPVADPFDKLRAGSTGYRLTALRAYPAGIFGRSSRDRDEGGRSAMDSKMCGG